MDDDGRAHAVRGGSSGVRWRAAGNLGGDVLNVGGSGVVGQSGGGGCMGHCAGCDGDARVG